QESEPRIRVTRRRRAVAGYSGAGTCCRGRRMLGAIDSAFGDPAAIRTERLAARAAERHRGYIRMCGKIHLITFLPLPYWLPLHYCRGSERRGLLPARDVPPPAAAPPHSGLLLPAARSNPASSTGSRKRT